MNKILNNIKNNLALYLTIIVVIIIGLILVFQTEKEEKIDYDLSMFEVIDVKEVNKYFEEKKSTVLFIGKETCTASQEFIPSLQIAQAKYNIKVRYLDLKSLDVESEDFKKLIENLDFPYTLKGEEKSFGEYIGATPMFIIIKEGKMVFGYIGTMTEDVIGTISKQYGATNE